MLKVLFSGSINFVNDNEDDEIMKAIKSLGVEFKPCDYDNGECIEDFVSRVECELDHVLQEKNYALNFF